MFVLCNGYKQTCVSSKVELDSSMLRKFEREVQRLYHRILRWYRLRKNKAQDPDIYPLW